MIAEKAVVNRRDRTARWSSITPYRLENIITTVSGFRERYRSRREVCVWYRPVDRSRLSGIYSVDVLLEYIRKIKPSHLSMQARYVIEAAICSGRGKESYSQR